MQLSTSLLGITDPLIDNKYREERAEFHKRISPIIATVLVVLAIVIEIVYRGAAVAPI
jgi:hypothetical protein